MNKSKSRFTRLKLSRNIRNAIIVISVLVCAVQIPTCLMKHYFNSRVYCACAFTDVLKMIYVFEKHKLNNSNKCLKNVPSELNFGFTNFTIKFVIV